jgi:hypothetical protein
VGFGGSQGKENAGTPKGAGIFESGVRKLGVREQRDA